MTSRVCTSFSPSGIVSFSGMPEGQQRTPGWSLPFSAMRSLYSWRAHGCSGMSSGFMSAAKLISHFTWSLIVAPGIQKPDRSGLPSDVRGGGAFMSIRPFGSRGTFFHGYDGHCASRLDAPIHSTAVHESAIRAILPALPDMDPPVGGEFYTVVF